MTKALAIKALILTGVALALVLAAVAWRNWYRPVVRSGPSVAVAEYQLPAPVAGLRLLVFNTSMNRMSWFVVGDVRPWRPNPVFVIQHPTKGLIVFDTGFSQRVADRGGLSVRYLMESVARPDRMIDSQMRALGLNPDEVKYVILSHLHGDHTGRVGAFRNAEVIAGPTSSAALAQLASNATHRSIEFNSGRALAPFDSSIDFFSDGSLTLLPGGGHTKEDLMVLVALPNGPALLAGDAVVHRDWLDSDDVQHIPVDPDRAAEVRNQVRALVRGVPKLQLFPGHDTPPEGDRSDVTIQNAEWFEMKAWMELP